MDDNVPLANVVTWVWREQLTLAFKIQKLINEGKKITTVIPIESMDGFTIQTVSKALIIFE